MKKHSHKRIDLKKILLLIVLWSFSLTSRADYTYMTLSSLIIHSENCVLGTIVKMDINYFYLKTKSVIFGVAESDTLQIMRFESWSCGRRYDEYKIGQKEIVCFQKSNKVIDDYELIGYGAGGEFEIQILADSIARYQFAYGKFNEYKIVDFISAIKDYKELSNQFQNEKKNITQSIIKQFEIKSDVHELLITQNNFISSNIYDDIYNDDFLHENEKKGSISNIETDYLYENYDNKLKVQIENEKFEDLILVVEDAEIRKEKDYFIVKPIGGWARRWIYVEKIKKGDTIKLLSAIFNVYPIPEPTVYINDSKSDSVIVGYIRREVPRVRYDLGGWYKNDYLYYNVLKFDVDIIGTNYSKTIKCKSGYGSFELRDAMKQVKVGDKVRYYNITVLYPDGRISEMKDKTVYVKDND